MLIRPVESLDGKTAATELRFPSLPASFFSKREEWERSVENFLLPHWFTDEWTVRATWMNRVSREEERMLEWKLGGLIGERRAISRRGTFTGLENNVRSVPVVVSVGRRMRIVIRIKGDELFYTFLLWNVFSRDDVQRFTFLKGWRDLHETCAFSCAVADAEIPAREDS